MPQPTFSAACILVAAVDAADSAKLALLARMREVTKAAMANLPRLAAGRAAA